MTLIGRPPRPVEVRIIRDEKRFWNCVKKSDGCWEWTGPFTHDGYGRFWCSELQIRIRASRYVIRLITGKYLGAKEYACHRCDNPKCVRPDHIFVGSNAENLRDMSNKGRHWLQKNPELSGFGGMANPKRKLVPEQVVEIVKKHQAGLRVVDLAREYGISGAATSAIVRGINWPEITRPLIAIGEAQ